VKTGRFLITSNPPHKNHLPPKNNLLAKIYLQITEKMLSSKQKNGRGDFF
jgi:hypothetical protein